MAHFQPDELKIISISAPIWLKLLRDRETRILNRLYGDYRNGKKDFLENVAEYALIREQILEITNSLKQYENQ